LWTALMDSVRGGVTGVWGSGDAGFTRWKKMCGTVRGDGYVGNRVDNRKTNAGVRRVPACGLDGR
jgi:hypothetical protein